MADTMPVVGLFTAELQKQGTTNRCQQHSVSTQATKGVPGQNDASSGHGTFFVHLASGEERNHNVRGGTCESSTMLSHCTADSDTRLH